VAKKQENLSIINNGLTVEGTVSCKGRLLINGTLKGVLEGEVIEIGQQGAVFADTKANSVTIGGTFEGEIRVNDLIIQSTGKLNGKALWRNNVVVEPGAVLNGDVKQIKENQDIMPD